MTQDDYIYTLPFVVILFCIACRAAGAPDAFLMPVIMGCFALIQPPRKPPQP